MPLEESAPSSTSCCDAEDSTASIYYFGYGPVVNPMVRKRRRLQTYEEQPAVLHDYRLTFAYGGIANIFHQRGFQVHGVLMKFKCRKDWKRFQSYDVGYNESDLVSVVPYTQRATACDDVQDEDADEVDIGAERQVHSLEEDLRTPISPASGGIQAYAMSMKEYDPSKLEAPIEQLPAERYLKLIWQGMREYKVDEDYIQDQIMSVPYIPTCKPEEYLTIPFSKKHKSGKLPKMTLPKYYKLCQKNVNGGDVYFAMNGHVIKLGPHDAQHPAVMWVKERLFGQRDATWIIHQTIVEPNLPPAEQPQELTAGHHAWAEHHAMEYFRKCNLAVEKVFELKFTDNDDEDIDCSDPLGGSSERRRASWLAGRLSRGARNSVSGISASRTQDNSSGTGEERRRASLPSIFLQATRRRRNTSLQTPNDVLTSSILVQREMEQLVLDDDDDDDEATDISTDQ